MKETRYGRPGDFQTTGYTYDANGALLSVKYGVGEGQAEQQWDYQRGVRGELLGVTQPGGGVFTYAYDGLLRLKSVTPPGYGTSAPVVQTFDYDYLGRPTQRTRGGATWTTTWSSGQGTQIDPNQDRTVTLLDGRGRKARVVYTPTNSAANTDLLAESYAYTAADQPWQVVETRTSGAVENLYTYDARRLLTQVSRGSETVGFTYTASGQRQTMARGTPVVTYGYDTLDRLSSVTGPAGNTTLAWEPGGARLALVSGGGLAERRCYDARGRLATVVNAENEVPCDDLDATTKLYSRFDYTYDGRGNRVREEYRTEQITTAEVTQYGYDGADRLTGVRYPNNHSLLYLLRGDGARAEEKELTGYSGPLGPQGFVSQADGQLQRHWRYDQNALGALTGVYEGTQPVLTYGTDAAGHVLSEERPGDQKKEYGWDAAGRLTQLTVKSLADGHEVSTAYTYGWDGLRVRRTTGTQTTGYLWAGGELVEEQFPDNSKLQYTQAAGMAVAVGNERIAHDALGSAVGRVLSSNTLAAQYRFDAWGNYLNGTGPNSTQPSLGYTGHAWDADAHLTYAQQRWYDSVTGRFLSEDPVGAAAHLDMPTGMQSWLYTNGNPLRYTDPDGRSSFPSLFGANEDDAEEFSSSFSFHPLAWVENTYHRYKLFFDDTNETIETVKEEGPKAAKVTVGVGGIAVGCSATGGIGCVCLVGGGVGMGVLSQMAEQEGEKSLSRVDPYQVVFETGAAGYVLPFAAEVAAVKHGPTVLRVSGAALGTMGIIQGADITAEGASAGDGWKVAYGLAKGFSGALAVHQSAGPLLCSDPPDIGPNSLFPEFVALGPGLGRQPVAAVVGLDGAPTMSGSPPWAAVAVLSSSQGDSGGSRKPFSSRTPAPLRGSGPAPGVIEVSPRVKSTAVLRNTPPEGIEFIFDPETETFLVGKPHEMWYWGRYSPHENLAGLAGADRSKVVGGMFFGIDENGAFHTNEYSGHYWRNWNDKVRSQFVGAMERMTGKKWVHTDSM